MVWFYCIRCACGRVCVFGDWLWVDLGDGIEKRVECVLDGGIGVFLGGEIGYTSLWDYFLVSGEKLDSPPI